ncbi:MAG: protein kinase [Ilumatobacter sp.]|nr:protein kinase [Ilumatobacter sp.]
MTRTLCERYELGRLVGAGGTAQVYEARDQVLARGVAVKLLNGTAAASNDPAGRERFLAEARSTASFSHPGAVAVFDAGEADGDLFIVMELVDGRSLAHEIAERAPMPEADAVRIGSELLDALGAAHTVGMVHRDVKPANILLRRDGRVKLADFGIAKRFDDIASSLTTDGTVIGTPRYLAPEQAAGRPSTPAVDIYAVGVVLHEMLTGAPPGPSAPLRSLRPDISPGVATAIARALAPDPDRRFGTAAEMAEALRGASASAATSVLDATDTDAAPLVAEPSQAPARARDATRVMAAVGAPPRPDAPTAVAATPSVPQVVEYNLPTDVLRAAPTVPPVVAPFRPAPVADRVPRWWVVALIVLVVVGIAGLALALRDPAADEPSTETAALTSVAAAPEPVADAEPVVAPGSEVVEDVFVAEDPTATLSVLPAEPPETAAAAAPAELAPGFPVTDDIIVFIAQLRDGEDVVGTQSKKLGDELHKLLEEDAEDQPEEARELAEDVREWVEEGELDSAVAAAALDFIAPLR